MLLLPRWRLELAGTDVGPLQGTATYDGAAAGKYTILDADADTAEGGHFTASAMLEANFDVAGYAASRHYEGGPSRDDRSS